MYKLLLLFFTCLVTSNSFLFPIIGDIGENYKMHAVPRSIAYKYIKNMEIESIRKNDPDFIVDELHRAREICRDSKYCNTMVTFVNENGKREPDFVILYRMSEGFSNTVYTIDSMLINKDKEDVIPINVVYDVISDFCYTHRGYLQVHPLKTWAGGRYMNSIILENSIL